MRPAMMAPFTVSKYGVYILKGGVSLFADIAPASLRGFKRSSAQNEVCFPPDSGRNAVPLERSANSHKRTFGYPRSGFRDFSHMNPFVTRTAKRATDAIVVVTDFTNVQ